MAGILTGSSSCSARRQQEAESAARAEKSASAARSAQPEPAARTAPRKDNPYLRPFGRLSIEQLESEIHEAERVIADCQAAFGDPTSFRDPQRGQKLQSDYESATQRLADLEQEYFAREQ